MQELQVHVFSGAFLSAFKIFDAAFLKDLLWMESRPDDSRFLTVLHLSLVHRSHMTVPRAI